MLACVPVLGRGLKVGVCVSSSAAAPDQPQLDSVIWWWLHWQKQALHLLLPMMITTKQQQQPSFREISSSKAGNLHRGSTKAGYLHRRIKSGAQGYGGIEFYIENMCEFV